MTVHRAIWLYALSFAPSLAAFGETLTIPAVTSLPPGSAASPFFSDVRVFNTSYTTAVTVPAVYRCFLGTCPATAPQAAFTLGARESRAFDDMVSATFHAPSSAGAVELTSSGSSIRVTSRLYSPAATGGTNGMFVPGMKSSEAHPVSVLTGLSNGLFRTNLGIYNGSDSGVVATVKLFDGGIELGTVTSNLGPRSGTQINRIFDAVGRADLTTTNAYAVVASAGAGAPLFTYAAVIDNATSDSSFVAGAEDQAGPEVETVTINVRAWDFSPGGPNSPPLVLTVGKTYVLVFHDVDPPGTTNPRHGFSGISELGLPGADDISPGHDVTLPAFTPEAFQRGTHPFMCTQNDCGGDPEQHRGMMGAIIVQ
ncbi:MAG TPA: hypothetical protein VFW15_10005 [Thermoanaerobaculia bacterium]|nr:hypothetical protein [Thermoanaerobaculia bacterium]